MRALRFLVLAILFLACFPRTAAASHLQGGTIYWERDPDLDTPVSPTMVRYKVGVELTLKRSFYNPAPNVGGILLGQHETHLEWGPVASALTSSEIVMLRVQSIDEAQDLLIASGTVFLTVPLDSPALRLTVEDCCRPVSLADGNGNTDQVLEAIIPVLNPQTSSPRSPRLVLPTRLFLEQGRPAQFPLGVFPTGATSALGSNLFMPEPTLPSRYRPTPAPAEGPPVPPGMTVDETTGLISWTPAAVGLYDIRITADNSSGAAVPLEFLLQVLPPQVTRVEFASGICGAELDTFVGLEAVRGVAALSSAPNDPISIWTTPLPLGATFSSASPAQLRWAPTLDARSSSVCFSARSASGAVSMGQCCLSLNTTYAPPPAPTCAGSGVPYAAWGHIAPAHLQSVYVSAGQTTSIDFLTYDECFNPVTTGGYGDLFEVSLGGSSYRTLLSPIDLGDGTYRFQFTPTVPGGAYLEWSYDGLRFPAYISLRVLSSPVPACSTWSDCASGVCVAGVCGADTTAPYVSIDTGAPLVERAEFAVIAGATDNGHLDSASVTLNGVAVGGPVVPDESGFVVFGLTLVEGLNTVMVQYRDHAGNVGGAVAEVTLDSTPPLVSFITPLSGQAVGSNSIDATLSVLDASPTFTQVNLGAPMAAPPGSTVLSTSVPVPGSGTFTLTAVVVDALGHRTSVSQEVLVDLAAPDVTVDVPNGAHFGPLPNDLLLVNVGVNSVSATTVVMPSGSFDLPRGGGTVATYLPLDEGVNAISIVVTDELGRTSEFERSVVYDVTAPEAVVAFPLEGQLVRGVMEVAVDVGVDPSAPVSGTFSVDGAPLAFVASDDGRKLLASLDTALLGDGSHALVVTLADAVGNQRTLLLNFRSDNRAPTVTILSPSGYVHGSIDITADARDASSGVASVNVLLNGATIGTCPTPRCVQSFDTTALADGPFVVSARVVDNAGNTATAADVTLTAINSVPSHFIVAPSAGAVIRTSPLAVRVAAPAAFFASAECSFDGNPLGVSTTPTFSRSVSLSSVLDGRSTVRCEVRDLAGRVTAEAVDVNIRRWQIEIKPSNLDIRRGHCGSAQVDVEVTGPGAEMLIPIANRALTLVVPGGTPVFASDGSKVGKSGKLKIGFDRAALVSSIAAGIAGKFIDPSEPLKVSLFSDTRAIGADTIRLTH